MFDHPLPGFHLSVVFEFFPPLPNDMRFQEVSGLSVSTRFESWPEGGENRFEHRLPTGLEFTDLVLKRGKFPGSRVLQWARRAVEDFEFEPVNLMVSLLDENHLPLYSWYVVGAVPKSLAISGIDAMKGEIAVESLTLSYQYFKHYDPASQALGALTAGA